MGGAPGETRLAAAVLEQLEREAGIRLGGADVTEAQPRLGDHRRLPGDGEPVPATRRPGDALVVDLTGPGEGAGVDETVADRSHEDAVGRVQPAGGECAFGERDRRRPWAPRRRNEDRERRE